MSSPYETIKRPYLTEKAAVLAKLKDATSNQSVARCENPKLTFLVDPEAKKPQIAKAIEEIYREKNIKVVKVNTINCKPKRRNKRGRMNPGIKAGCKKAIVTLAVGNVID
jgi:large subunit ribosomal protein L23